MKGGPGLEAGECELGGTPALSVTHFKGRLCTSLGLGFLTWRKASPGFPGGADVGVRAFGQ